MISTDPSLNVTSTDSFFFEISDTDGVFNDNSINYFLVSTNRVFNHSENDNVSMIRVKATAGGNSMFPENTIIELPSLRNGAPASSQPLPFFEVPYSVTVLACHINGIVLAESHNVLKYVPAPSNAYLQPAQISSAAGRILIEFPGLKENSAFNTSGLKYLVQIDGPDVSGNYKSRNYLVDASNVDGSANFTTQDQDGHESIKNNENFDVHIFATNATGHVDLSQNLYTVLVSANANAPYTPVLSDNFNAVDSIAKFTIEINGDPVDHDPDQKYILFIAENTEDGSGTNLLTSQNTLIDASSDPIYVTTTQLGLDPILKPAVQYLVKVAAINSTLTPSPFSAKSTITPESKPSDLTIQHAYVRLLADETDPSGVIKVVLKEDRRENGTDVRLYAIVVDAHGIPTVNGLNDAINAADKIPISDLSLNHNAFILKELKNDNDYVIGVMLENHTSPDLSVTSFFNVELDEHGKYIRKGDYIRPGTALTPPDIKKAAPLDGSFSLLGSGKAEVQLGFPEENPDDVSGGYLTLNREYVAYRVGVKDASGNEIHTNPEWLALNMEHYKAKGYLWTDSSSSLIHPHTVVTDSSTNEPTEDVSGTWVLSSEYPIYDMLYNTKPYIRKDGSGNPVTISVSLSGLDDSKTYIAYAQMETADEETAVDHYIGIRTSAFPVLDPSNSSLIGCIFDLTDRFLEYGTANATYETSMNYVKFSSEGILGLLDNVSDNGNKTESFNVVFIAENHNLLAEYKSKIAKIFNVLVPSHHNHEVLFGKILYTDPSFDLSTVHDYKVVCIAQNPVYNQGGYIDVSGLLKIHGLLQTSDSNPIKLSKEILDVSGDVVLSSSVEEGHLLMNIAFVVADDSDPDSTKFHNLDIILTRQKPVWNDASQNYHWSDDAEYVSPSRLLGLEEEGTISKDILIDPTHYGWRYQATVNVNSSPSSMANVCIYTSTKQSNYEEPARIPTIILDNSNVLVEPNGSLTTVETIIFDGYEVTTTVVDIDTPKLLRYNTFEYQGEVKSHEDHGFGQKNFQIDLEKVVITMAFNVQGRTSLSNEQMVTLEVVEGHCKLRPSPNDGIFDLVDLNGNVTKLKIVLKETAN